MKKLISVLLLIAFLSPLLSGSASALNGSDFPDGRIIDESIFTNKDSMTVAQIQAFFESKVNGDACDRNRPSSNPSYQPPYTCLFEFQQNPTTGQNNYGLFNPDGSPASVPGGISAAQIVWQAAQDYDINPQVLIVLMQKEKGLVTDNWPWTRQYSQAAGFNCPDTAPCDPSKADFSKQIRGAAWSFRYYMTNDGLWYPVGANNILYHPNQACGRKPVNIESLPTSALYLYTPYVPNQAALDNLYGTGDSCSAYGNRNFWRYFNDWFGPTSQPENYWALIQDSQSGEIYLETTFSVHYVPSTQTLNSWGLNNTYLRQVTNSYISSKTLGSPLDKLLRDKFGNIYAIDSDEKHYVSSKDLLDLWGIDINSAVTINGLISEIPETQWFSLCAYDRSSPAGNYWVVDSGRRHPVLGDPDKAAWRCNAVEATPLSSNFLNDFSEDSTYGAFVSYAGSEYLIDSRIAHKNPNGDLIEWYNSLSSPVNPISSTLHGLLEKRVLSMFAEDTNTGTWNLINNGRKHYIPSGDIASLWGATDTSSRSRISSERLGTLTNGDDLTSLVRDSSSYYLIDRDSKHLVPSSTELSEWSSTGQNVVFFDTSLLAKYPTESTLQGPFLRSSSNELYIVQNGVAHRLASSTLGNWGAELSSPLVSDDILSFFSLGQPVNSAVVSYNTRNYFLDSEERYEILDPSLLGDLSVSQVFEILPTTLSRYTESANTTPRRFFKIGDETKYLREGMLYRLSIDLDDRIDGFTPKNIWNTTSAEEISSPLFKNSENNSLWYISDLGKTLLGTTADAINLGYLSGSLEINSLSPLDLDSVFDSSSSSSFVIQNIQTGSLKLVVFNKAYSLPHEDIVIAYAEAGGGVLRVPERIFESYSIDNRFATRLIKDDSGKIYWIDGPTKRWILNGDLLDTVFLGVEVTYLESTATTLIPNGEPIF